jgi:hypothetical protein
VPDGVNGIKSLRPLVGMNRRVAVEAPCLTENRLVKGRSSRCWTPQWRSELDSIKRTSSAVENGRCYQFITS